LLLQRAKKSLGSKEAAISAALSEEELAFPNFFAFSAFFCLLSQSLAAASLLYSHRRACLSHPQAAS
jgi:hypothetical protein